RAETGVRAAQLQRGAGDEVTWLAAPEGVLAFRRGDLVCTANTGTLPAPLPPGLGKLLLASGPYDGGGAALPADTTAWWTVAGPGGSGAGSVPVLA
ncbi:DUF3459 domain-containing protein, partial [Streptomyces daliensis]|nr:DUF3459 domain-containing protein [Streptomyces daliensis]